MPRRRAPRAFDFKHNFCPKNTFSRKYRLSLVPVDFQQRFIMDIPVGGSKSAVCRVCCIRREKRKRQKKNIFLQILATWASGPPWLNSKSGIKFWAVFAYLSAVLWHPAVAANCGCGNLKTAETVPKSGFADKIDSRSNDCMGRGFVDNHFFCVAQVDLLNIDFFVHVP